MPHTTTTPPTTLPRLPIGCRVILWYRPHPGHLTRISALVREDNGRTVTVGSINDWSEDAVLVVPRSDIIRRVHNHRRGGGA